jgi:carboxypeptidase family protein
MRTFVPVCEFLRPMTIAAVAVAVCACGGTPASPSAPTAQPAAVAISNYRVTVSGPGTPRTYRASFTMTETSGRTAASVTTIRFGFGTGASANADPSAPIRINPGESFNFGVVPLNDTSDSLSVGSSVTLTVGWSDDSGRPGSVTAAANVSEPLPEPAARTFTLAGVISDVSGRPIAGASVAATDSAGTRRTSTTDGAGYYSIAPLREGPVTVAITASGYQLSTRTVSLSGDTRLDLSIAPSVTSPRTTLRRDTPR